MQPLTSDRPCDKNKVARLALQNRRRLGNAAMATKNFNIWCSKAFILLASALTYGSALAGPVSEAGQTPNYYGMPGLVEMPSAASMADAEIFTTLSTNSTQHLVTLGFQITPRLTGAFRYGRFEGLSDGILYDRSFDLQYRLVDDTGPWPALSVGLRDLIGTGVNSSEYFVATKQLRPRLALTAGLGWGAMGSYGSIANPFGWDTRTTSVGLGGKPDVGSWFHGPAAPFAGLDWQATDRVRFALEYSSDAHLREVNSGTIDYKTPFNLGVVYTASPTVALGAQLMHGSVFGMTLNVTLNPKVSPSGGDRGPAPAPFALRTAAVRHGQVAAENASTQEGLTERVASDLHTQGIRLVGLVLMANAAHVRVQNDRYGEVAQMIGRVARVLADDLPPQIEVFEIDPSVNGMATAQVTLRRGDLERFQYSIDQTALSYAATTFDAATGPVPALGLGNRFTWGVRPYISLALFDPVNPLRGNIGLQTDAGYAFTPNLSISGGLRLKAFGNEGASDRASTSVLPHVRSDAPIYARAGASGIEYLTLDHFGKIGPSLFNHLSVGYLEAMFAGVSAEVLWQPVDSRLQVGAELSHVFQRDPNKLFGVHDYDYAVTVGQASVYYQLKNGFDVELDAGRYLAGDWGSTLTISRTFDNGWRIGTFATLTNVSFNDFGEGSFDKGFIVTAPLAWLTGHPSTTKSNVILRPIQRDGGAQLDIRNRLHDLLRGYGQATMAGTWGTFWR
jgi:hypothetical protein